MRWNRVAKKMALTRRRMTALVGDFGLGGSETETVRMAALVRDSGLGGSETETVKERVSQVKTESWPARDGR